MNSDWLKMWWPVLLGLAVLYIPTYYDLSQTIWRGEENSHGPMVLLASVWMFWRRREVLLLASSMHTHKLVGGIILSFGLLSYAIGRSQEILMFEVGSQIPVLLGTLSILLDGQAVRRLGFPILFLLFMVPLPNIIVDAMTNPLKQQVSMLTENILYVLGYPIARNGVVLSIGPYQVLVADACSGLYSMFSLSALGLLYLYLLQYRSKLKNALLVISILPIAFCANFLRVLILVLVTYHLGDEAGQGFTHIFAGIILFVVALVLLFVLDGLLGLVLKEKSAGL